MEPLQEFARRTDLLPATLPYFWVLAIFALAIGAWHVARWATRKYETKLPLWAFLPLRMVGAIFASWAGLQVLCRHIDLTHRWPLWIWAIITGAAVEFAAWCYKRERKVLPRKYGIWLTVLRAAAITLAALILMQPVYVRVKERNISRRIAVLMDESLSMLFKDELWTASEKLAWGREFGLVPSTDNPLPSLHKLDTLRTQLQPWASLASAINMEDDGGTIAALIEGGAKSALEIHGELEKCVQELAPQSKPEARAQREVMEGMKQIVWNQIGPSLDAARNEIRRGAAPQLLKVTDALKQYSDTIPAVRLASDEVYWMELSEAARQAVDALCATTRVELAHKLLLGTERRDKRVFIDRLAARYDVDLFRLGNGLQRIPRLSEKSTTYTPPATPSAPAAPSTNTVDNADSADNVDTNAVDGVAAVAEVAPPKPAAPEHVPVVAGVEIKWDLGNPPDQGFRMSTDFAMALESVQREISSEQLAGVLIVSDGIHNGMAALEPVARRLGAQRVPVMGVRVGGSRHPFDIAVADVNAPESIFLGDNTRIRVLMRATNARGKKLNVELLFNGSNVVDSVELDVTSDLWQREIRFKHMPAERGIVRYEIRTPVFEGELFEDNNAWSMDVAVSDDRTNVLLIDGAPRWEFQYLRNLFYGRDKSVHLQYYTVNPDTITGLDFPNPLEPASASRAFGDAEAGGLPISRDEWRKFDIIIIGDLPPDVLTEAVQTDIRHCVEERGAMLVMIAGQNHMPHAYAEESPLRQMLPMTLSATTLNFGTPPDREGYTIALTPSGKTHPVMQQSSSLAENDSIWAQMPDLGWRIPVLELRPGAEILAYALPSADPFAGRIRFNYENVAQQLEETMREQRQNALIIASRFGRGKTLSLMFDRTWRFRYRVGDTYHHRFWGQVMRWGVGEKLRAGDEFYRLGTDQVVYTPGTPVQVFGRVLSKEDGSPIRNARLLAIITPENDRDTVIARQRLTYREDSNGIYESEFTAGLELPGRYTVHLHRADTDQTIDTQFLVTPTRRPVELADVAANSSNLERLARLTNGRVVEPDEINDLLEAFGEGRRTARDHTKRDLWDEPLLFILIVALLTTEWVLRKRRNLT